MPEGVRSSYPIEVVWEGGKRFRGGIPGGPSLLVDGDRLAAPSPVDSLLVALGSCSAIDVVEILEKRRTPATSVSIHVEFSRAATTPRRLTEATVHFRVATDSEPHHVERAVQLSFEKYCSVATSLAPDTELGWSVMVLPAESAGGMA
ncbi:MAG: OsmC family protein [Gemmatimonadota bacterium]